MIRIEKILLMTSRMFPKNRVTDEKAFTFAQPEKVFFAERKVQSEYFITENKNYKEIANSI